MKLFCRLLACLFLVIQLVACGGGGGSPGVTSVDRGGASPGGGTATTPPTDTAATPKLTVSIHDSAQSSVSGITVSGGYVARARLVDAKGQPVAGKAITFSLGQSSIAVVSPNTALTDAAGVAEVGIFPSSVYAIGAATVDAKVVLDGVDVSGEMDFSVTAAALSLASFSAGATSLPSGGNTSLSITALVDGVPASGVPINIGFVASCGRINGSNAGFSVATDGSGVAQVDYTALQADGGLCSGPVTITAGSPGADSKTLTLNVAAATATAVTFVSASANQIYVQGFGALEQSILKFKVLSGSAPMGQVNVNFTVPVNTVGVSLTSSSGTTNADGEVSVVVNSGTVPGPVKVRASLAADDGIFTETQNLTVASGPPSQRFMSLSVETYNIEGATRDGTPTRLTVRLADRQGNAVQDGTVVNFTTEGGQVSYSCATQRVDNISSCSVDFVSQNPRPTDGRVSVLAFTSGTKDYEDLNGNNRYDAGTDILKNIGDPYRDDDESNAFEPSEFIVTRGGTLACPGNALPFPGRADTCDTNLATTVRQQAVILFSSSDPQPPHVLEKDLTQVRFALRSAVNPKLPLPAGTSVEVTSTGDCSVDRISPASVPNVQPTVGEPDEDLATEHTAYLSGCTLADKLVVKITTPADHIKEFSIPLAPN